jgi:8-oxo-dGTP pyrophosphatase MutT (NUDIX family)
VSAYQGLWNGISGFIDEPKSIEDFARQELSEELSLSQDVIERLQVCDPYEVDDREIDRVWVVYPVLAVLREKPKIVLDWEHTGYAWIKPGQLADYDCVKDFDVSVTRALAAKDGVTHFSTGVAVVRDGKVLVVLRVAHDDYGGVYELPGGGVEPGECFADCVAHEMTEETGLHVTKILRMLAGFDYATSRKPHVRQINFVVEVGPGEVQLDHDEHDDFRWIGPEDVDSLQNTDQMKTCLRAIFALL